MMTEHVRRIPSWVTTVPRGWLATLLAASLLAVAPQATASGAAALDVLKATTTELTDKVARNRDAIAADPGVAREMVRQILSPLLDLDRTSRWVLGKYWSLADQNQKARFIEEFQTLLIRTYATAVAELAAVEVEYFPVDAEPDANDVTVQARVARAGAEPIGINYRMHRGETGWKVYDVSIDGVSLVTTYRSSFARVVRNDGIDGLIDRLAEKNRTSGQTS